MVIVVNTDKVISLGARGKLGYTAACGLARCGYSRCGSSKDYGGIYQRKKTLAGWRTSRMRYYRPTNPQTETQQSWRAVLTAGWTEYNSLTLDQKLLLSKEARLLRMTGANLFMRRWLQANR